MTNKHWSQFLTHYQQDEFVIQECAKYDSFHQFWTETKRGDCMLHIAGIWSKREPLVLAACACARLALPYVKGDNEKPRIAIETVEAWAKGKVDIQQVKAIADGVHGAYFAVVAATAATDFAFYAGYAAETAAYDAGDPAYEGILEQCAQIARQMLPEPPFERYYNLRAFL